MQTDAVFRLASMTKPLVMAALMQFYDSGQFKLDEFSQSHKYKIDSANCSVIQSGS